VNAEADRDDSVPAGLLHLGRRRLSWLVALYTALTIVALAIPALVAQPRGEASHLSQQEVQSAPGMTR
jgi:hypothetical protein